MPLNTLVPLNPLASIDPTTITNAVSNSGNSIANAVSNQVQKTLFGMPLANAIIVILGLLLIAAGIFGFDKTRELVVSTGKKAVGTAAIAA